LKIVGKIIPEPGSKTSQEGDGKNKEFAPEEELFVESEPE
jgi:hypothetical protein